MSFVVLDDACQLLFLMIRSSFLRFIFSSSSVLSDVGAALQQQHNSAKDATTKSLLLMADQRNDSPALNLQTGTATSTATRDKSEGPLFFCLFQMNLFCFLRPTSFAFYNNVLPFVWSSQTCWNTLINTLSCKRGRAKESWHLGFFFVNPSLFFFSPFFPYLFLFFHNKKPD